MAVFSLLPLGLRGGKELKVRVLPNSRKENEEHKDSIRLGITKKYRNNIKGFEIKNRMTLRPCFCFEKRLSRIIFLH